MNKRGFIKTVEAIIAILLIFIFVYYITPKITDTQDIKGIKSLQTEILKGISENEEFRKCIITCPEATSWWIQGSQYIGFNTEECTINGDAKENIQIFIEQSLPPKYQTKYKLVICEQGSCEGPPDIDTVYTSAIIITSSLKSKEYNPKILRLYFW